MSQTTAKMGLALACISAIALLLLACPAPANAATEAEIEQAIVDGLAYLAGTQQANGSWWDQVGYTGLACLKFEDRARELGFTDPMDPGYEYHQVVIDCLDYLSGQASDVDISSEPAADGDGDGIGKVFSGEEIYNTGCAMMALAASQRPDLYGALVQDALDWMCFAQNNSTCGVHRGGWSYAANECWWSDNSNGGYATLGLGFATAAPPAGFGLTIPQFVKDELSLWIDALQDPVNGDADDGGSHYDPGGGWVNILKTGNLLYEMGVAGDTALTQRAIDAIDYIERHWTDPGGCDVGWLNHRQAMFTMMKGLEGLNVDLIDTDGDTLADDDWFDEVSTHLVNTQDVNGSWPDDCWGNRVISTAWALLTLEKFVAPPLPEGACCNRTTLICQDDIFEADCIPPLEWTEGVDCIDLDPPCVPDPEACCMPDGSCVMILTVDCLAMGGVPQGPGSVCTTPQACCWPDDTCAMVDPLCCGDLGGTVVAGDCGGREACCDGSGYCYMANRACCLNNGDTPRGVGTVCLGDADADGIDDACDVGPGPIPTVSTWGLGILALMLVVGAKVYFSRRRTMRA